MTMGDIIVLGVLALIVGLIIRSMIRDKKKGKCGGCSGCSGCASSGCCNGCCGSCNGK